MPDISRIKDYFTPSIQLDLFLIALLLFFVLRGVKKGLVMSISGVVGLLTGIFGGMYIAEAFSKPASEMILPMIQRAINGAAANRDVFEGIPIDDRGNLLAEAERSITNILSGASLPKFALPGALERIGEKIAATGADLIHAATQVIAERIAYLILFVLTFIALQIAVFILFKAIDLVAKVPVVKTLNGWGGGVLGFISGVATAIFVLWFVSTFFASSVAEGGILSPDSIGQSFLAKPFIQLVYSILP